MKRRKFIGASSTMILMFGTGLGPNILMATTSGECYAHPPGCKIPDKKKGFFECRNGAWPGSGLIPFAKCDPPAGFCYRVGG